MSIRRCLFALLLPFFASAHAWADPLYTFAQTTFEFLPAGFAPAALNDAGQVVGTYGGAAALLSGGTIARLVPDIAGTLAGGMAFARIGGTVVPVGARLPGDMVPYSYATDINDAGMVAGNAQPFVGEAQRGFLYDGGGIHLIGACADVVLHLVPAVPEPGSRALLCAGLGLLAWRARRRRTRRALMLGLALAAPAALADPLYSATFLPENFTAYGIGSDGSVVGSGTNADFQGRAFVWKDGATTFLPTLGGPSAYATAINGGTVIGASLSGDVTRGFVYRGGDEIRSVGTLYGGDSIAYGINAGGQVVGESTDASGNSRAFLYRDGTLTDIGTLGGTDARARGINGAGMIVGGSQPGPGFPDDGAHAFLYHDGAMQDLGTLGGGFSWAEAINDAGQVAGYSLTGGNTAWHPFLYSGGVMLDLGSFGGMYSEAHAINAAGVVVGYSSFADFGFSHAFMYAGGSLVDLNTVTDGLGIQVLMDAVGINDAGQIVANSCNDFGFCAPVVLTPVPEPAAALLLLAGIPVLLWRRKN